MSFSKAQLCRVISDYAHNTLPLELDLPETRAEINLLREITLPTVINYIKDISKNGGRDVKWIIGKTIIDLDNPPSEELRIISPALISFFEQVNGFINDKNMKHGIYTIQLYDYLKHKFSDSEKSAAELAFLVPTVKRNKRVELDTRTPPEMFFNPQGNDGDVIIKWMIPFNDHDPFYELDESDANVNGFIQPTGRMREKNIYVLDRRFLKNLSQSMRAFQLEDVLYLFVDKIPILSMNDLEEYELAGFDDSHYEWFMYWDREANSEYLKWEKTHT